MSDAKRTPYRNPAAVPAARSTPRGPVVRRPEEEDDARRLPTSRPAETIDPDAGVFSGLVSPHPASSDDERIAQIVLTVIGMPLIVATFLVIGWLDTRRAYNRVVRLGENTPKPVGIAHPGMWLFGAAPFALACFAAGLPWPFAVVVIGVPFAALFARRRIRARIVEQEALLAHLRERRAKK